MPRVQSSNKNNDNIPDTGPQLPLGKELWLGDTGGAGRSLGGTYGLSACLPAPLLAEAAMGLPAKRKVGFSLSLCFTEQSSKGTLDWGQLLSDQHSLLLDVSSSKILHPLLFICSLGKAIEHLLCAWC